MTPAKASYHQAPDFLSSVVREDTIEYGFIGTLQKLKYGYRPDITNRATLEANFREKFEALNQLRINTDNSHHRYDVILLINGYTKTLTSFKAATLLKENAHVHKCVFVVDRKGLDRQTREEFNRFQEGCVEENTNTAAFVGQRYTLLPELLNGVELEQAEGKDAQ